MRLKVQAFAKVNPYLKIVSKRQDGYHNLRLSFLSIGLADQLIFVLSKKDNIVVETNKEIPLKENLCYQVAKELKDTCHSKTNGVRITIDKQIPIGAGLGGGSSDAAATLTALNKLWNCQLSREELINLGANYGSDIPFFFYGGFCHGTGTGTKITKHKNIFNNRLIPVLVPPFSHQTPEVYDKFDKRSGDAIKKEPSQEWMQNIEETNFSVVNDLQKPAMKLNPELNQYLEIFENSPLIQTAGISGSGSALFGIARENVSSARLQKELSAVSKEAKLYMTRPTDVGHKTEKQAG